MSTAVQTRSTIDLAALKTALEVTVSTYDAALQRALTSAKELADQHLNRDFIAADGTVESIPQAIEQTVIDLANHLWGGPGPRELGVVREKAGDLEVQRAVTLVNNGVPIQIETIWDRFRFEPGL